MIDLDQLIAANPGQNFATTLNDAIASAADYDYFQLRGGVHSLDSKIVIDGKSHLTFNFGGARMDFTTANAGFRFANCQRNRVQGGSIRWETDMTGDPAIELTDALRTSFESFHVWNAPAECMRATDSWWLSARNCTWQRPAAGKNVAEHHGEMHNVYYGHVRFAGFRTDAGRENSIGLLHNNGAAVTLDSCDLTLNGVGAHIAGGSAVNIVSCYIEDNGLQLRADSAAKGVRIEGNYFNLKNTGDSVLFDNNKAKGVSFRRNSIIGLAAERPDVVLSEYTENNVFATNAEHTWNEAI